MSDSGQPSRTISPEYLSDILRREFPGRPINAIRLGGGWLLNPFTGRIYYPGQGPNYEVQMTSFQEPDGALITQPMIILCPNVLVNEDGYRVVGSIAVQIREDGKIRSAVYLGPTGSFLGLMNTPLSEEDHSPAVLIGHINPDPSFIDGVLAVYLLWIDFPDNEAIDVDEFLTDNVSTGSATQMAVAIAYNGAFPDRVELTPVEIEIQKAYTLAFPDEVENDESTVDPRDNNEPS